MRRLSEELSKISKIIPRKQLGGLLTENVIKDYLRRHFINWKTFSESAETFIQAHIFKRRIAEKIVEKIRELVFSDFEKDIKEISADFEAISLSVSPSFDIIKVLNSFFEEYPLERTEKLITKERSQKETDDDWEIFRETLYFEKEKRMIIKEKMMEMIFYYAEENEEIRSLIKNF